MTGVAYFICHLNVHSDVAVIAAHKILHDRRHPTPEAKSNGPAPAHGQPTIAISAAATHGGQWRQRSTHDSHFGAACGGHGTTARTHLGLKP